MPADLINPKSTLTGETPEMRDVVNWYIDITKFNELMNEYVDSLPEKGNSRPLVYNTIKEFMLPPMIYIKKRLYRRIHCNQVTNAGAYSEFGGQQDLIFYRI